MNFIDIENKLLEYQAQGKRMFITSSFQTHSIPILHIISRINVQVDVLFINTGFHFPETVMFRDQIAKLLGLKVINVQSNVPKYMQVNPEGQLHFVSDPDFCCHLNKVEPVQAYLKEYDVWINGVRADQSSTRKAMRVEQPAPHNTVRFHPMLDWNSKMIYEYRRQFKLPEHPLDAKGYMSIGCEPCTRKFTGDERSGRWFGMKKTECGLHTTLA